jgi:hypothetical protein
MDTSESFKLPDGRVVEFISATFDRGELDFIINFTYQGETQVARISSANFWWENLTTGDYSSQEDELDADAIEAIIDEFESSTEFYEDDYRYLPRQKGIPAKLMDQLIDNFLEALKSGEYFDGGMNDGPPYAIELLASPSLSAKQSNRIYAAIFEGTDEDDALDATISEYDEGSLIISADDLLMIVKKLRP